MQVAAASSTTDSTQCPTPTSTDGRSCQTVSKPSGVLSSRQITALIQQGKWWPFDRVDGKLLVRMHKHTEKQINEDVEDALL